MKSWSSRLRLRNSFSLTPVALAIVLACRTLLGGQEVQKQAPGKPERAGSKKSAARTAYDPTDRYDVRLVEGWTVLVSKRFLAREPKLARETLALLSQQLRQIVRRVPAAAVKKLRTIHFWVEEIEPHHPCMTYHPNPDWLRDHDMNPEKARCVELSNARIFSSGPRSSPGWRFTSYRTAITISFSTEDSVTPTSREPSKTQ